MKGHTVRYLYYLELWFFAKTEQRAFLKVGRCSESEIDTSDAPVNIITKGRVLDVRYR